MKSWLKLPTETTKGTAHFNNTELRLALKRSEENDDAVYRLCGAVVDEANQLEVLTIKQAETLRNFLRDMIYLLLYCSTGLTIKGDEVIKKKKPLDIHFLEIIRKEKDYRLKLD